MGTLPDEDGAEKAYELAEALGYTGLPGAKSYSVRCPAHDDSNPSLNITATEGGKVLLKCHAGCTQDAVIAALKERGLWQATPPKPCTLANLAELKKLPVEVMQSAGWRDTQLNRVPVIEIPYRDPDCKLLATQYRVALTGKDRFKFKRGDSTAVLYGLDRWKPGDEHTTILVEGATDVLTARLHGFNALGVASASAFKNRIHSPILNQTAGIYFIEEPDDGGKQLAAVLAKSAIQSKVRRVRLGEFKDLNELHCADPEQFAKRLDHFILDAQPLEPPMAVVACLEDIEEKPVEWLTKGGIDLPLGKLILLGGDPGVSKSTLTCDLAAAITTTERAPWSNAMVGEVLILSAEDDAADTIKPRLRVAGANLSRVHIMIAVRDYDDDGNPRERSFNLAEDVGRLVDALERLGSRVRLVIIDPISAYLGSIDSHKNADVRGVLAPVAAMAARWRVAVVAVSHLNKGDSKGNVLYRVMGSLAFVAAVRSVFLVVADEETAGRRLFLPGKQNLSPDAGGYAFRVLDQAGIPKILWEVERAQVTAQQALSGDKRKAKPEIVAWLKEALSRGSRRAAELWNDAEQRKFSTNHVKAAKAELHVTAEQRPQDDGRSAWWWYLAGFEQPASPLPPEDPM